MIPLIFLLLMEVPVRIKIPLDHQRPECEDRFTPFKSPSRTGELHASLHQMAAGSFAHPRGDGIALGQVGRRVELRRVLGHGGGTLIHGLALCGAHAFGRCTAT